MSLSRDDARAALEVIGKAGDRMLTLRRYSRAAPYLMIWGSIWIIANCVTDFAPARSKEVWLAGTAVGVVVSVLMGLGFIRRAASQARPEAGRRRDLNLRYGMMAVTMCCLFPSVFSVIGPLSARQSNAFISLLWAFVYMAIGSWVGWRLFAIGAMTAAATLFGYWNIQQHYYLWMAVCGGGALLAGGFWLRKI